MKLTQRHAKAAFNLGVGLRVTGRMLETLEAHKIAYKLGSAWVLTSLGCDLAAGRRDIKRGQIVRVKR